MPAPTDPLVTAERALLCVCLNDAHAVIPIMDVLEDPDYLSLPLHRQIYGAILALTRANVLPNVYTVADKASVPVLELQALAAGFNTKLSKEIIYTAEIIRKAALCRRVQAAVAQAGELASVKTDDPQGLAVVCAEMVMGSVDAKSENDPSVSAVGKRFDIEAADMTRGGGRSIADKLAWLQEKTAGLRAGKVWVIAAPYKCRKTTLMRNMVIAACRAGAALDIFALEGAESDTYSSLVAMLATEKLIAWGMRPQATFSDTFMLLGRRTPDQQHAITEARAEVDAWNLRIYDGRQGITRLDRLIHFVKRDRVLHGLNVFALDYLQLLGEGKLFERMEASTHRLSNLTVEDGLTAILVAQVNEASIGADNYSPGVKGGGDAAAAADYLITTKYNGAGTPDVLTVNLKLARHARVGVQNYWIEPISGVLLGAYGIEAEA